MAYKRRPTARDHNALGAHFFRIGVYDLAVAEFWEAARLLPSSPVSHINLACAYHACHREEEAIAALRRAISLDAGHTGAHLLLGQCLAVQGEFDAARAAFEAVVALQPDSSEAGHAREELTRLGAPPHDPPKGGQREEGAERWPV